jgi:hypothetical protein
MGSLPNWAAWVALSRWSATTPRLAGIRYSGPPENRSGADADDEQTSLA